MIILGLIIVRSQCFIIENEEVTKTSLVYYGFALLTVLAMGSVLLRIDWNFTYLMLIIFSMAIASYGLYTFFKGDLVLNKIHLLSKLDVNLLIAIDVWVIVISFTSYLQKYILISIVIGLLLYKASALKKKQLFDNNLMLLVLTAITFILINNTDIILNIFGIDIVNTLNDTFWLKAYLPTFFFIVVEAIIIYNSKFVFLVEKKIFLKVFSFKNILCYILIPRLWIGDHSKIFKSTLFQTYQVIFVGSTLLMVTYLIYEGIMKHWKGQYRHILDEDYEDANVLQEKISYGKFYLLR